jgi:formylglycine-generating enzyme required for sulfatase activity
MKRIFFTPQMSKHAAAFAAFALTFGLFFGSGCESRPAPAPPPAAKPEPPAPTPPGPDDPDSGVIPGPLGEFFINKFGMEFALIPTGKFQMGAKNHTDDEKPVREVTIPEQFYMGRTEVTQLQWKSVMGDNPSFFKNDKAPVDQVSWLDCQEFIKKLNDKRDGYVYRLPSEAEWEYVCRSRTTGDYYGPLDEVAWYEKNAEGATHPIGEKKANAFGMFDMHGNVWEWCQDVHHESYAGAPTDGAAWEDAAGSERVIRGGAWDSGTTICRSSFRYHQPADARFANVGFRVVCQLAKPQR